MVQTLVPTAKAEAPDFAWADVPHLENLAVVDPERFFENGRGEQDVCGAEGLCAGPSYTQPEVERIKALVMERLQYAAAAVSQEAADELGRAPLERYHDISERYDHARMLSKQGRILSGEAVQEIKRMSFFAYVREVFGEFALADEEDVGHEQVCIRVVRPQKREDVGFLHRDTWFWEYYGWAPPAEQKRAKVWTGICVDGPKNGLLLAPGSHRKTLPYRPEQQTGKLAFVPQFDWRDLGLRRFAGDAGDSIFFNYNTLHGGSVNKAETCRVSIETTILFR